DLVPAFTPDTAPCFSKSGRTSWIEQPLPLSARRDDIHHPSHFPCSPASLRLSVRDRQVALQVPFRCAECRSCSARAFRLPDLGESTVRAQPLENRRVSRSWKSLPEEFRLWDSPASHPA